MPNLVLCDLREPATKCVRRVWERQDSPAHKFGSLQFVMKKSVKKLSASMRIAEGPSLRSLLCVRPNSQFFWASRSTHAQGGESVVVQLWDVPRGELVRETVRHHIVEGPSLQGVRMGLDCGGTQHEVSDREIRSGMEV